MTDRSAASEESDGEWADWLDGEKKEGSKSMCAYQYKNAI